MTSAAFSFFMVALFAITLPVVAFVYQRQAKRERKVLRQSYMAWTGGFAGFVAPGVTVIFTPNGQTVDDVMDALVRNAITGYGREK